MRTSQQWMAPSSEPCCDRTPSGEKTHCDATSVAAQLMISISVLRGQPNRTVRMGKGEDECEGV